MDKLSLESFLTFCENNYIAKEGLISPDQKQKWQLKGGPESKEAKELRKQARKVAKSGNYTEAIALTNKAMNKYKEIRKEANKIPQKSLPAGYKYENGSHTYTGMAKNSLIKWINRMISECQADILKYKNKIPR